MAQVITDDGLGIYLLGTVGTDIIVCHGGDICKEMILYLIETNDVYAYNKLFFYRLITNNNNILDSARDYSLPKTRYSELG